MNFKYDRIERHWLIEKTERNRRIKEAEAAAKAEAARLSNAELFSAYSELCGGDDHDGDMTKGGYVVFDIFSMELNKRLVACGFLNETDVAVLTY